MKFNIGDTVRIKTGASKWLKDHQYWIDEMGDSVDGLCGIVTNDYTDLPGNDSHCGIDIYGINAIIGIHPMWLTNEKET